MFEGRNSLNVTTGLGYETYIAEVSWTYPSFKFNTRPIVHILFALFDLSASSPHFILNIYLQVDVGEGDSKFLHIKYGWPVIAKPSIDLIAVGLPYQKIKDTPNSKDLCIVQLEYL